MDTVSYLGGKYVKTEAGNALSVEPTVGHLVMPNGSRLQIKRAWANAAAAQTDLAFIPGVAGATIRILALAMMTGGTATNVTFNSQTGAGAGAACSPLFALGQNGGMVLPEMIKGWIQALLPGDNITLTTGAGSTTGITALFIEIPDDLFDQL